MFRGMEYIYEVWNARSFSAAAKKLYISQPALSNSVKRVEEKVGSPIFDRSTSPIQLTEVGREYIHAVEQILSIEENFSHYLADTQQLKTGSITIGSGAMMSSYLLPDIIVAFKEKYPYVEVNVIEGSTSELKKMLTEGVVDLVIENSSFPATFFESQVYRQEHIVLAVPKKWEVNASLLAWQQSVENIISGDFLHPRYPAVPLEAFAECPFLLLTPDDETYQRAMTLCERSGFEPWVILKLAQQLTSYNMVCAGLGAAFVSDTLVKSTLTNPNVVYYKLDGPEAKREISFCYKRNRYIPRCMKLFLEEVETARNVQEGFGE